MDKDQYDEQAERLLPCKFYCADIHEVDCPVEYRPAVAAALREAGKREADWQERSDMHESYIASQQKKIDDLRREVERLRREQQAWRKFTEEADRTMDRADAEIAALKAKLDNNEREIPPAGIVGKVVRAQAEIAALKREVGWPEEL